MLLYRIIATPALENRFGLEWQATFQFEISFEQLYTTLEIPPREVLALPVVWINKEATATNPRAKITIPDVQSLYTDQAIPPEKREALLNLLTRIGCKTVIKKLFKDSPIRNQFRIFDENTIAPKEAHHFTKGLFLIFTKKISSQEEQDILKYITNLSWLIRNLIKGQVHSYILQEIATHRHDASHVMMNISYALSMLRDELNRLDPATYANIAVRQSLDTIMQSTTRLGNIFNMFPGAQQQEKSTKIAIGQYFESIFSALEIYTKPNNIKLSLSISCPESVINIPLTTFFTNGILNIVHNAVEATANYNHPNKKIDFRIFAYNKHVLILCIDNGPGIPMNILKKINAQEPISSKGSGLGLASARKTLRQIKGTLSITSKYRKFTCVAIRLPAQEKEKKPSENTLQLADFGINVNVFSRFEHTLYLALQKEFKPTAIVAYNHLMHRQVVYLQNTDTQTSAQADLELRQELGSFLKHTLKKHIFFFILSDGTHVYLVRTNNGFTAFYGTLPEDSPQLKEHPILLERKSMLCQELQTKGIIDTTTTYVEKLWQDMSLMKKFATPIHVLCESIQKKLTTLTIAPATYRMTTIVPRNFSGEFYLDIHERIQEIDITKYMHIYINGILRHSLPAKENPLSISLQKTSQEIILLPENDSQYTWLDEKYVLATDSTQITIKRNNLFLENTPFSPPSKNKNELLVYRFYLLDAAGQGIGPLGNILSRNISAIGIHSAVIKGKEDIGVARLLQYVQENPQQTFRLMLKPFIVPMTKYIAIDLFRD